MPGAPRAAVGGALAPVAHLARWLFQQEKSVLSASHTVAQVREHLGRGSARAAPEVAFIGRSNCGKSTLVNALVCERVSNTSKTPGRTQAVLRYRVGPAAAPYLVVTDLPGYGYANAPVAVARDIGRVIGCYAETSVPWRRHVIVIVDARRGLLDIDHEHIAMLARAQIPFSVVLSKADCPSRAELERVQVQTATAMSAYGFGRVVTAADPSAPAAAPAGAAEPVLAVSAKRNTSIDLLRQYVVRELGVGVPRAYAQRHALAAARAGELLAGPVAPQAGLAERQ